jgi:hypothetical protein
LSVYVTYMRDRGDIRNVVWSGAGISAKHLAVIAAWGLLGLVVALRRFRWTPRAE